MFLFKVGYFCISVIRQLEFPMLVRTRVLYSYKNKLCTLNKGTLMK